MLGLGRGKGKKKKRKKKGRGKKSGASGKTRRDETRPVERHYVDCNCATSEANWIGHRGHETGHRGGERKRKRAWLARFRDSASRRIVAGTRSRDDNGLILPLLFSPTRGRKLPRTPTSIPRIDIAYIVEINWNCLECKCLLIICVYIHFHRSSICYQVSSETIRKKKVFLEIVEEKILYSFYLCIRRKLFAEQKPISWKLRFWNDYVNLNMKIANIF